MNLISKSLTILTSAQLLVVCTYILEVLRFCRFLTNFGAWNDETHDHAMTWRKTKAKARTKDRRPWWLEARSCTSTLQWSPKDKDHKIRSRPMGWIGGVHCEKFWCYFMAQTCALIAPVQPILHRLSCSNETLQVHPNTTKHTKTRV